VYIRYVWSSRLQCLRYFPMRDADVFEREVVVFLETEDDDLLLGDLALAGIRGPHLSLGKHKLNRQNALIVIFLEVEYTTLRICVNSLLPKKDLHKVCSADSSQPIPPAPSITLASKPSYLQTTVLTVAVTPSLSTSRPARIACRQRPQLGSVLAMV
jgi:hypothetical protein